MPAHETFARNLASQIKLNLEVGRTSQGLTNSLAIAAAFGIVGQVAYNGFAGKFVRKQA